jgi:HD-like signal output (HDOD) protein
MSAETSNSEAASANPPAQSSESLVKRLFTRISEVSTLPTVAVRIIEVANDPTTGAEDLLGAVRYDAALATRILRTVNSSYYSMQNKVADLKLAITLLGFKEIRNLAMTAYIAQLFKKRGGHGSYTREGLWNHLIGVGIVAQLIAETSGRVPPREAYLAGLLHDLGLILIDQYLNKPFRKVIDLMTEETPICEVERQVLGFDHAELGEFVAGKWNLPKHLVATIRHHHAVEEYEGDHLDMVATVALADFFCSVKGVSQLGVRNMRMPASETFASQGLSKAHVSRIWEQLDEALKAADVMALVQNA